MKNYILSIFILSLVSCGGGGGDNSAEVIQNNPPSITNSSLNVVSYAAGINSISIHNLNGQEVLNTKVNANQIRLNTSEIATGLYIISIKSDNTSITRKLMIE